MCLNKLISPIVCLALLAFSDLAGVVKKDDLVARWTFDEGNGSIANDSLNGGSPLFMNGSNWGQEEDGNALSKFSMDISTGEGFAVVEANRKFQVTSSYSIMLWFKTNGLPDDYAQLLNKRESTTYSYLFQINPGGTSLEALYRATGQESQYATTGPVYFNLNQWNCFLSTYDGNYLRSYLNGKPTGILELPNTPLKDDADFGVGGSVDGSNLFKGWIDEFRFYSVPLDRDDAVAVYGEGFGDLGARPVIVAPAVNADANSTVYVSFEKTDGTWSSVTQFQASDIEVSGAELTGFQEHNDTHYRFHVVADKKPQRIKIRIPAGSAKDDGNFSTSSGSARIQHIEPITSAKNLVGWWTFDEASTQSWESNSTLPANADAWTPLTLSPKVWLDAYDLSSLDKGTSQGQLGQPANGESIQFWADKSGNEHHAKKRAGNPTYIENGLNSKPTIQLNSASLALENSRTPFDNWEELHVFAVLYQTAHSQFASIFGKTNTTGWANNNSYNFSWFLNMHRSDKNGHKIWGPALNTSTGGNAYMQTSNTSIWTHDGFDGGPSVISISYSSFEEENNFKFIINGQTISQSTLSDSIKSTPSLDFVIGGRSDGSGNWKGKISEFILFDKVLEGSTIPSYLDDKWAPVIPLLDSNQSTFVFEDQSGGDRPMFFYGETQNNQNLFGSTLGFDGGSNFGKIDLLDRNQSTIELADVTLPNLLHAWWPFDGDGQDHSGNERHGQMIGNGAFGTGRFDQALDLQNGGIFRVPEENDPGIYENSPRTLSMWLKTLAPSGNLVKWGIQEDGKQWNWSITSSNGMGGWMRLGIYGANQTGMHYMVSDGKWRHLAVSMIPTGESSFSLNLFVDGRQESKFLSTINKDNFEINTQPSDLFVGGDGFSGWIDDLRIYSTRLNSGEISMILEEKIDDDLTITRGNYSLSAWIKPTNLPENNRFNFANARFFWRDWAGDTRIDTWPHNMRKTGIPKLDPSSDLLSELFEEPVSFYALAVDNNPSTDTGWNTEYIGYESNSISSSDGFFSDTNLTDGPWLLENENGGTAYSPDFLSSLSETPNSYASSFGTSFYDYGTQPRGFTIAHGSLAFEPGNSFAPGLFYLRAGGHGRNTFWLDKNQNLTFDEVDSGERIIKADSYTEHEKVLFLGHQIPIIATPGIENDRGLAITGKRSISSWEQNGDEPISSLYEYSLNQGEWAHVVMTVNRNTHQLSTFVNGRMVATSALQENELAEPRLGDWFIGGPGPFNSSQYFAGQIDDLRIYDDALTPEEISRIYNGGEGDIGLVGTVSAPVVTDEETVTFRIAFEKFEEGIAITGITEAEINASLTNGEIVGGSLVSLGSGVFEFDATFTSYQQMILDLPRGAGSSDTEDTLRVMHKISRVPEVPQKEDLVHWWWLDESIGKSVSDSMGTSDGTIQGATSWTADSIFGTAVSFRNEGDFISLGSPDTNLSKEEFTVSLWFKRVANSSFRSPELIGNIMLSLGGTNGESIQIGTGTSNLEVYMNTLIASGNVQMGRGIEEGRWNHLLLSYDANSPDGYELKFYLNGQLQGESGDFGSSLVIPANSSWKIGRSSEGRFIGEIDDVRIYSAVLGHLWLQICTMMV